MIDTLKLAKGLQKAGFSQAQSEEVAEALKEAQTDYVPREYLDAKLESLKGELQRFVFVSVVLVAVAQILVAKFWH
jgi:hypothetical protein